MIRWITLIAVLAAAPALLADDPQQEEKKTDQTKAALKKLIEQKTAETQPAADKHPRVHLDTTYGHIVLELNAEKAPITVKNFLEYVDAGFYNGTIFHRVMSTFMIQGGGYTPEMDEKKEGLRPPIKNEWKNGLKNKRDTIAMARKGGDADSASSQFFINVVDNDRLDQPQPDGAAYAVFGKVIVGMDTVDKIRYTAVQYHPKLDMGAVVPAKPAVIKSAKRIGPAEVKAIEKETREAAAKAAKAQAEAKAAAEKQLREYIAKVEKQTGKKVQKTASGLMYVVLKEGDGPSPKPTDTIAAHYVGTLLDGTKFDSSIDRGQPMTRRLDMVIKGWTEGIGLMKVGGISKLIIPPHLAYANRPPAGSPIPPNATLVFNVTLLDIKK